MQGVDSRSFSHIGHALWAVILACLGGIVSQLLAARGGRRDGSGSSLTANS